MGIVASKAGGYHFRVLDLSQHSEAEVEDERAEVKKMDMAAWKKHVERSSSLNCR